MLTLAPGPRSGRLVAPPSKSHAHRLLIANFLAGVAADGTTACAEDSDDIRATRRCLAALAEPTAEPLLDCGESGSTLRFLAPIAAALGKHPRWQMQGRLAMRPFHPYATLEGGLHTLPGDVSSQFVTGLLFALPLLDGDSRIRFTTPLESRGYVDMTLDVLAKAGIVVQCVPDGFDVPGRQRYRAQPLCVEGDWSGTAFWLAMNALGSHIEVAGLNAASAQPDRAIVALLDRICASAEEVALDMRASPDIFPVLALAAGAQAHATRFTGIRRLRLKECDRVAAMADVLARLGVAVEAGPDVFVVKGRGGRFTSARIATFGDHRIAMTAAVGATFATGDVEVEDSACVAKSYPRFFDEFRRLSCSSC